MPYVTYRDRISHRSYQRTWTRPESAIFESAVTNGAFRTFAVATMKRSQGSRSIYSGILS